MTISSLLKQIKYTLTHPIFQKPSNYIETFNVSLYPPNIQCTLNTFE